MAFGGLCVGFCLLAFRFPLAGCLCPVSCVAVGCVLCAVWCGVSHVCPALAHQPRLKDMVHPLSTAARVEYRPGTRLSELLPLRTSDLLQLAPQRPITIPSGR